MRAERHGCFAVTRWTDAMRAPSTIMFGKSMFIPTGLAWPC